MIPYANIWVPNAQHGSSSTYGSYQAVPFLCRRIILTAQYRRWWIKLFYVQIFENWAFSENAVNDHVAKMLSEGEY